MKKQIEVKAEVSRSFGLTITREYAFDGSRYFKRSKVQRVGRCDAKWSKWEPAESEEFEGAPLIARGKNVRLPKEVA